MGKSGEVKLSQSCVLGKKTGLSLLDGKLQLEFSSKMDMGIFKQPLSLEAEDMLLDVGFRTEDSKQLQGLLTLQLNFPWGRRFSEPQTEQFECFNIPGLKLRATVDICKLFLKKYEHLDGIMTFQIRSNCFLTKKTAIGKPLGFRLSLLQFTPFS